MINIYYNMPMIKCKGLDRYSCECNIVKLEGLEYCKFHEYLSNYSEDQIENFKLCKGCLKWKDLSTSLNCGECKIRGEANRKKFKENIVFCKKEECKFKKSKLNEYCGKHQIEYFKEETEKLGKKVCTNFIRGCKTQLDRIYLKARCETCLSKDRINDKKKRGTLIINLENVDETKTNNNLSNKIKQDENEQFIKILDANIKLFQTQVGKDKLYNECFENVNFSLNETQQTILHVCTNTKCKQILPEKYFVSDTNKKLTTQCQFCRDINKIKDTKESRKITRGVWKDENHEKTAKYCMDYRGRQMKELGEKYYEKQAEQVRIWKKNNPEKVELDNKKRKQNINYHYDNYKRDAKQKNLEFKITLEEFLQIVKSPCFYCKIIQEKGFNGLDKKVCTEGYILDNIVSCCEICNFMKGTLTPEVFVKRVEHILTCQNIIQGNLYPEYFIDCNSGSYSQYKSRAQKADFIFEISKEEYNLIIKQKCYLCHKKTLNLHTNGIDRIDSKIGYVETNIKSCCSQCNYMKNNYEFDEFINKLKLIYENVKNYVIKDDKQIVNHLIKHLNKVPHEQRKKEHEEKITKQKENTIKKYNNDEYKTSKALELKLLKKLKS